MKNLSLLPILAIALLFLVGCQKDVTPLPKVEEQYLDDIIPNTPADAYWIAMNIVEQSEWPIEKSFNNEIVEPRGMGINGYVRTMITNDIAHYKYEIGIGAGPYDRIGIHRVVKETAPNRPIKTGKTLFYQHGDAKDFEGMMLPGILSVNTPDDFGMAIFLAENDVDVWGIDQAWTKVPEETSNFDFMADWGLGKQLNDLRKAMSIARLARYLTGSGLNQMILAGYSSGAVTGYAALNAETQVRPGARHIEGFIALDMPLRIDPINNAELKAIFESDIQRLDNLLASGEWQDFIAFRSIARLAKTEPDSDSPIFPGFTNLQVALFFGAGQIAGTIPFHYLAGTFENDFPNGFQFTTLEQWYDFLEAATPWEPARFLFDYQTMQVDVNSPFNDHLNKINVPIMNVAAGGGFGSSVEYGMSLLGSTDITNLIIRLYAPEEAAIDFGHIDLFIADNAESVAWMPILDWINAH